ncbi:Putative callose synthase 6 [Dendrobium catenatum]|uniref:Callose synthase 6 n=1 Tax=Dendrobium catenatum TaxID=906689 RepID=A0A2I0VP60_9ASPA|nr:Putative callose synthase 6 [Dendrobium catenatum]
MDTQIWYAIFSTIFGGINGAFSHLGEKGEHEDLDASKTQIINVLQDIIEIMTQDVIISGQG